MSDVNIGEEVDEFYLQEKWLGRAPWSTAVRAVTNTLAVVLRESFRNISYSWRTDCMTNATFGQDSV